MAEKIIEYYGADYQKCIDDTPGAEIFERYYFNTKAKNCLLNDGATVENRLSNFKGVTTNEDQKAGYAADITLLKSIKTHFTNLFTNLSNLVNSINNRLGGLRFYEDSTGKYIVGADSVPKKLGSLKQTEWTVLGIDWFGAAHDAYGGASTAANWSWQPDGSWGLGNGCYQKEANGWRITAAKKYDVKSLRADYQQLTAEDFTTSITAFFSYNENAGHKNDKYYLNGPQIDGYDPATGILTVSCDGYLTGGPVQSEAHSLCVKVMLCA